MGGEEGVGGEEGGWKHVASTLAFVPDFVLHLYRKISRRISHERPSHLGRCPGW